MAAIIHVILWWLNRINIMLFTCGLTHLPLVPHICVNELGKHWFRLWLVACPAPSHYPNQCWFIVKWTLGNKLQWNFNKNTKLSIHENASENIVCELAAILSRGDRLTYSNITQYYIEHGRDIGATWTGLWNPNTVRCHYKAIQDNMILNTLLQWLRPNINQTWSTQKTPHNSPNRQVMGCILW